MRWLLWRHDDGMGVSLGDQADHRLASGQGGGGGQGQQRSDEGVAQGVSPRRGLQTGGGAAMAAASTGLAAEAAGAEPIAALRAPCLNQPG